MENAVDGTNSIDVAQYEQRFVDAVDDDLNFPGGMGVIFELIRDINGKLHSEQGIAPDSRRDAISFLDKTLDGVFGLKQHEAAEAGSGGDFSALMDVVLEVRAEARKQKQFAIADLIRDRLAELEIVIEDSKQGSVWKRERKR